MIFVGEIKGKKVNVEDVDIYSSMFINSHTPMLIIKSESGEIKDGNLAACNYYGYSIDELRKLYISDINILSREEIFEQMELAKIAGRMYFQFKHRLSNGEIREVEVYSGPISVKGESLLLSIVHDTQYKRDMEQKIKIQESYFKNLFENSPEAIAIFDNEFRFININKSFVKIFQYTIDEIKYKNVTEVICNEKLHDESTYFKDSIKKGEFVRKDTQRKRKDGKLIDFSFLGYPILSNGEQVGVYGIYTDITEKKRYEEEIKTAKYKAEEASKFKTKFLANVAHEIRTPMNGIVGIVDLLDDNQLSSEHKEYFEMLRYSAARLSIIINDVIDIAKIEAGKLELRQETFHLNKLLNDIQKYFKIQAEKKDLILKLNVDTTIPDFLLGDPDKLNQVIFNLLSNAIKFTNQGSIHIDVILDKRSAEDVEVNFSIRDTGIGIPKEQADNIFCDFYQLDSASTKKCRGAGLGLAISQKLVHLMGGHIMVESEYGKGSNFHFTVKFKNISSQDQEIKILVDDKTNDYFEANPAINVFLIDDEIINQQITRRFLEKKKCKVTIANNGKEALQIMNKQSFDIILMDMYMPELDGFELVKVVRQTEKELGKYTPIIAITAAVMDDVNKLYSSTGIDDYIPKPFKKEQLYSAIEKALYNQKKNMRYDLSPLLAALEGDNELLDDIIKEFTSKEYEVEIFGKIEIYRENNELEGLKRHLHKFKGSISHFHVASINNTLRELSVSCKKQDIAYLKQLVSRLRSEYLDLKDYLIEYVKNIGD